MKLVTGNGQFGLNLIKALKIDHLHVSSFKMTVNPNDLVEIDIKTFLIDEHSREIIEEIKKYNLASWDLVRFCQTGNGYF